MQAGAKGTAGKGGVRVQEALWQELESFMKLLHSTVVLVWHLQRVLNKKRDPLTLASFVEVVQVLTLVMYDLQFLILFSSVHVLTVRVSSRTSPEAACLHTA